MYNELNNERENHVFSAIHKYWTKKETELKDAAEKITEGRN